MTSPCKKGDEEGINVKCTIGNVQLSMKNEQCASAPVFRFLKEVAKRQCSDHLVIWGFHGFLFDSCKQGGEPFTALRINRGESIRVIPARGRQSQVQRMLNPPSPSATEP
jgi:hypothetical protein